MDEEGSIGSHNDTVQLKPEIKSMEEAIMTGMDRAGDNASLQSQEDTVSQLAPVDRGRFQNSEHWRYEMLRLKARKTEQDFYNFSS